MKDWLWKFYIHLWSKNDLINTNNKNAFSYFCFTGYNNEFQILNQWYYFGIHRFFENFLYSMKWFSRQYSEKQMYFKISHIKTYQFLAYLPYVVSFVAWENSCNYRHHIWMSFFHVFSWYPFENSCSHKCHIWMTFFFHENMFFDGFL